MNFKKIGSGLLGVIIGYQCFLVLLGIISGSKIPPFLEPLEALKFYLFGFVWTLGYLGACIGISMLIVFLGSFYLLGVWVYKKFGQRQS